MSGNIVKKPIIFNFITLYLSNEPAYYWLQAVLVSHHLTTDSVH